MSYWIVSKLMPVALSLTVLPVFQMHFKALLLHLPDHLAHLLLCQLQPTLLSLQPLLSGPYKFRFSFTNFTLLLLTNHLHLMFLSWTSHIHAFTPVSQCTRSHARPYPASGSHHTTSHRSPTLLQSQVRALPGIPALVIAESQVSTHVITNLRQNTVEGFPIQATYSFPYCCAYHGYRSYPKEA
ncbi:unnamed protein product [Meganyctiphanes norvegica]|uniref:Secreted protein n=1 Tax=Meganyctiphanes norvegica TaxID=48144 RepID=A0AAV2QLH9_MEGNR